MAFSRNRAIRHDQVLTQGLSTYELVELLLLRAEESNGMEMLDNDEIENFIAVLQNIRHEEPIPPILWMSRG